MNGGMYQNFDLTIQRSGTGYRVLVDSPAGQATLNFSSPFSEAELENLLLEIGQTPVRVRGSGSPEKMQAAQDFGGRLFDAVFAGEVLVCFRSSENEAKAQNHRLRIRLRLSEVPELAALPWEYLYYKNLGYFLALSRDTSFVRYLDVSQPISPLRVRPPLKVLAMISSPVDYPRLDVEREWYSLQQALTPLLQQGSVALERLDDATTDMLDKRLAIGAHHVLHFIGHGELGEEDQESALILKDMNGKGMPVSGRKLGMLLRSHSDSLRLAVLNACEGGRGGHKDLFTGPAQSLIQQGIPAVIAMQSEITDEAAIRLTQVFYKSLAEGQPVDAALAKARKKIFAGNDDIEWGTPVLYMRSPDGRIFDVEQKPVQPPSKSKGNL